MKILLRQFIIILLVILIPVTSLFPKGFQYGFKGFLGGTSLSPKNYLIQLGYGFGAFVSYDFEEIIGFESNLLILTRKTRFQNTKELTINYFALPILLKVDPLNIGVYFAVGPQINFPLYAKVFDVNGYSTLVTDYLNDYTLDIVLAVTYQYHFITFEVRYEFGLTDTLKEGSFFIGEKEKNRGLYVGLGLNFS